MVVDDVQWADPGLRDVVLYLLAGPRDRRLAVLVTLRTIGLPVRSPRPGAGSPTCSGSPTSTGSSPVPLSRYETEAQLVELLGGQVHQSLVEDAYRVGRGNPYLTSLLARNVHLDDRHLAAELPSRSDHVRLREPGTSARRLTRTLTCLLAVGGSPERSDLLQRVADDLALETSTCRCHRRSKGRRPARAGDRRRLVVPPSPSGRGVRAVGRRDRPAPLASRIRPPRRRGGLCRRRRPWSWPSLKSVRHDQGRVGRGEAESMGHARLDDRSRSTKHRRSPVRCAPGDRPVAASTRRSRDARHALACRVRAVRPTTERTPKRNGSHRSVVVDDRRRRTAASGQRAARPPNAAAGDGSGGVLFRTGHALSGPPGVGRHVHRGSTRWPWRSSPTPGTGTAIREAAAAAAQALAVARTTGKPPARCRMP